MAIEIKLDPVRTCLEYECNVRPRVERNGSRAVVPRAVGIESEARLAVRFDFKEVVVGPFINDRHIRGSCRINPRFQREVIR